ncbi:MAG: AAA family ATPase [Oscillospiraceae bacterium]
MNNFIITISRGFGSNGIAIGKSVAKTLGISYYDDKALCELASERLRHALDELDAAGPEDIELATENVFMMQAAKIRSLAEKENFVIMGRAADYILRDVPNVIRINIHSGFDDSVKTVAQRDGISDEEAREKIKRIDCARAEFYQKHTGGVWNDPMNFDLTLNSSSIGRASCVELIVKYVEIWKSHHGIA